ncbi:MAG: O-antigen ligase family protein, partial [Pseudomonadota bacterium]
TPLTLTATGLCLLSGAGLAWLFALKNPSVLPPLSRGWWFVAASFSLLTLLQVLPIPLLARWFGPYPDALFAHPELSPTRWSPNPGMALRGWAVFMALFAIAWIAGHLRPGFRGVLWLAISLMAIFQALYGLSSHAGGATHILGIWERNNPAAVHGSFSNRNLFAGYLALTWPLVVAVWWLRDVPLLRSLPKELKIAGSVISGAIIGAALMGSTSRLGATAGLVGMLTALLLWTRYRGHLKGAALWPAWAAAFAAFLFATWYGLAPLTDRLAATRTVDAVRLDVWAVMLRDIDLVHWIFGVGLGGFEAAFKTVQPADITGWWDYAHNDLLQWLLEAGLVGAVVLGVVLSGLWRHAAIRTERMPLYAGLVALVLVGIGDFSWHIPGTQVVLAIYLGVLMQPALKRYESVAREENSPRRRRKRRRRSHN